jgi:sporulation protein YlmC with PRC-barrel domain
MLPKRFRRTLVAAAIAPALAVTGVVVAAGDSRQAEPQQQSQQMELEPSDLRASRLTGMDVRNAEGAELGDVQDLVIDMRTGQVAYVALAHGGILGMGEDLYAYPVKAFSLSSDREELVLDATEEQIESSRGFNEESWPKLRGDRDYWWGIERRFGARKPASADAGAEQDAFRFVRASELVDRTVQDRSGNEIGEIEDIVVSLDDGQIRFAVLDTADDDMLVPVPMEALSVREALGAAAGEPYEPLVRYEKERMDLSQAFDRQEWESGS